MCFTCRTREAGNNYAGPYSAYCATCQPIGEAIRGCHCASCGRSFGGVTAFDRHQTLTADGVVCRDPATLGLRQSNGTWHRDMPARLQG